MYSREGAVSGLGPGSFRPPVIFRKDETSCPVHVTTSWLSGQAQGRPQQTPVPPLLTPETPHSHTRVPRRLLSCRRQSPNAKLLEQNGTPIGSRSWKVHSEPGPAQLDSGLLFSLSAPTGRLSSGKQDGSGMCGGLGRQGGGSPPGITLYSGVSGRGSRGRNCKHENSLIRSGF